MAGRQYVVIAEGRRYRLGWTDAHAGIWRRRVRRWRLIARYPLGDDGLRAAQQHFASLEPSAVYVNLRSGTPLADVEKSRWRAAWLSVVVIGIGAVASVLLLRTGSAGSHAGASPSTPTTTVAVAPPGGGWVSSSTTEVDYMQWGGATPGSPGTFTKVQLVGQAPSQKSLSTAEPLTASLQGRQVTLTVAGSAPLYGSLSGHGLAVNWPRADGTEVEQVFEPVSAGGYDQAVEALVAQAVSANAAGAPSACVSTPCLPVPPAPQGYQQIRTISSVKATTRVRVHFAARPLELCFAVSDPSVGRLTFQIGSSWFSGPTTMFDNSKGNSVINGCKSDPGNDSGGETVSFHAQAGGAYAVAIYQALP